MRALTPDFRMKKEGEIEVSILGRWEKATFPTHQDVMKTLIKKGPQKVIFSLQQRSERLNSFSVILAREVFRT